MLRAAFIIMLLATAIGTLMPGQRSSDPSGSEISDNQAIISTESEPTAPVATATPAQVSQAPQPSWSGSSFQGGDGVSLQRAADGHFYADVLVNNANVRFMVDTGASGVALAQGDARSAGIAFSPAEFQVVGQGASGDVRGQPVQLDRISLGGTEATDLPAVVLDGSPHSLLGQTFLRQFRTVTIEGDTMVLR